MRRTGARALTVAGLAGGLLLALAPAASAHPLGNFTVNTADRVVVGASEVRVQHAVDLAEIPTLQLSQAPDSPDADRDGTLAEGELSAWATAECTRTVPQLSLVLDGRPAALAVASSGARRVEGAAGLPTLRLDCALVSADVPAKSVAFEDRSAAGRTGWKEVSATALCGSVTGDVVRESPSALLEAYPADLLSSPPAVTTAAFAVETGGSCRSDSAVPGSSILPDGVDRLTAAYSGFVSRQELTLPVALLAVLLSIVLGVGHAVAPGHGKTVIAAYLVGQRGTRRQAVWLGATVTATHTAGVLLLGLVLSLTDVASPERFLPATEVASGLLLAGVGVFLLRRALRARAAGASLREIAHGHSHGPEGHSHGPEGHDHGPEGHSHGPEGHDHGPEGHDHGPEGHDHGRLGRADHAAGHQHHVHDQQHGDPDHQHGEHDDQHGEHDDQHGEHDDQHGEHDDQHDPDQLPGPDHDHDHPHSGPDHDRPHGDHEPAPAPRELVAVGGPSPVGSPSAGTTPVAPAGEHSHHGRSHSHLPDVDQPLGWRTLATMGVAGGLVPSPSALLVLLGASALGRPVFGALLVVGYGIGMALTLTLAGLLLLRAQARLERRGWTSGRAARLVKVLPALTAGVVLTVGAVIVLRGLLTFRGLG